MLLDLFGRTFRSPQWPDPDWERLRLNLLKRSLTLILPVVGAYLCIMLILGQPILPAVAGLGFATAVLALVQLRPDARRAVSMRR